MIIRSVLIMQIGRWRSASVDRADRLIPHRILFFFFFFFGGRGGLRNISLSYSLLCNMPPMPVDCSFQVTVDNRWIVSGTEYQGWFSRSGLCSWFVNQLGFVFERDLFVARSISGWE